LQRGGSTYGISMEQLLKDASQNTTIEGGDRIFAEEDNRYFLSLGAAGTQAQHRFTQDRVTALDAISIVGGLTAARANAKGILILRRFPEAALRKDGSGPSNARMIFTVDLTTADGLFSAGQFQIRSGDLIYVSESPFSGARTVLALVGSVFGLAAVVSKNSN
jgi:polysaccharide biosynthesis/export protein